MHNIEDGNLITTLLISMFIQPNYLRVVRKKTQLTQIDIAALLKISDFANVSRWEQGLKMPNVDALLVYHLLFDVPIESLFDKQKSELKKVLASRIEERIGYLRKLPGDPKLESRIGFLSSALTRLAAHA
jgi:transcriptional regulator with XRE-family HTH domain